MRVKGELERGVVPGGWNAPFLDDDGAAPDTVKSESEMSSRAECVGWLTLSEVKFNAGLRGSAGKSFVSCREEQS